MLVCSYPLLEIRMSESQDPSQANSDADDTASDALLLRHQQFVECLERHGPDFNGNEWSILASDLGWSEEEVQQYAYEYLSCLAQTDEDSQAETQLRAESLAAGRQSTTTNTYWSPSECVLFDTLVAMYRGVPGDPLPGPWADVVASHFPSKSASDVRDRYRRLFLESNQLR